MNRDEAYNLLVYTLKELNQNGWHVTGTIQLSYRSDPPSQNGHFKAPVRPASDPLAQIVQRHLARPPGHLSGNLCVECGGALIQAQKCELCTNCGTTSSCG
jgi:hypothetical protein